VDKYKSLRTPPPDACKPIAAGRLKGKTDINPQWRIDAMNDAFGLCGIGWQWAITRTWREDAGDGQVFAFAEVAVRVRVSGEWSEFVPGVGGNFLVEQESRGPHASDEGYKMAITDALSVALKFFGVGAEVYRGHEPGKYSRPAAPAQAAAPTAPTDTPDGAYFVCGVVERVASKPTSNGGTRYGLQITGQWYNSFDTSAGVIVAGQSVNFSAQKTKYGLDIVGKVEVSNLGPSAIGDDDTLPF
jgi:hypothetical protein